MDVQPPTTNDRCPRADISGYLDGELTPHAEMVVERHLAGCKVCLDELNSHKQMLSALDFAFGDRGRDPEIELPENFARVVAVAAESNVSGLRGREERRRAFVLCAGLFALVLAGVGAELARVVGVFTDFVSQVTTLSAAALRLIYEVVIGLCLVFRALSQQFVFSSMFSILLLICSFILSFIVLSRLFIRYNRSQ